MLFSITSNQLIYFQTLFPNPSQYILPKEGVREIIPNLPSESVIMSISIIAVE
jgi:hypothetical protein